MLDITSLGVNHVHLVILALWISTYAWAIVLLRRYRRRVRADTALFWLIDIFCTHRTIRRDHLLAASDSGSED